MAFNAVEQVIAAFPWLADLGDEVYSVLVSGIINNEPMDVIVQNVRNTPTYKRRFAGLDVRRQEGFAAITEAEYLEVEAGYFNQLREFGVLGTLGLNTTEDFRKWAAERIGQDVSVGEVNRRLDRAEALANDLPFEAQQAFEQFYGVTPSHNAIVTYFLDEERGMAEIENQLASATIGAEALSRGLNINRTRAEILRREGVTADLARQGFADVAREQPVLTRLAQIHGATPLGQEELEEFFFHEDAEIGARRHKIFSQALAEFQGGGSAQRSRSGGLAELVDRNRTV